MKIMKPYLIYVSANQVANGFTKLDSWEAAGGARNP
jgi:hypothetical protein